MSAHVSEENAPHAIEVTAMLGNSVVGVKHCIDPKGGKITPATWAIAAGGLVALLLSGVAFVVSVSTAAANQSGLAYWTHMLHRPAGAFRAELLSPVWDWLAFGGLAFGLGGVALALARIRDERRTPTYRVGTAPGVDQPLDGAPTPEFPLVAPLGDDFVFQFAHGIDGDLLTAGKAIPLAELAASGHARPSPLVIGAFALPIPQGGKIRARAGRTTFLVSSMPQPRRQASSLLALESRTLKYFAGSLIAHLALVALLNMIPEDAGAANISIGDFESTAMASSTPQQEDAVVKPEDGGDDDGTGGGNGTAAMKLPEGAAGVQNGAQDPARMQVARHDNVDPQLARAQAIEYARTAGVLGDAALTGGIADISADTDFSSGFDAQNVVGPIYGPDGSASGLGFGYGRTGFGPGGGGNGIIGSGGYGTICRPGTKCFGYGNGPFPGNGGGPGSHGHHAGVPTPVLGTPNGSGGLDKSIIRRYIKRNIEKIAYCYEHQLLAHPDLEGTIQVQFFIQPDGGVKASHGAGFDPTVANCVADVVASIQFPKPDSGGGVEVNYPFTFHPAGHD
jgi:hypothetical protein